LIQASVTREYSFAGCIFHSGLLTIICSELAREATGIVGWMFWFNKLLFARSTEYGSRTLVHAASQGPESHGQYFSDCAVAERGGLVKGEDRAVLQERVWKEVSEQLEKIKPGIMENL
jgi:hypothetical protein